MGNIYLDHLAALLGVEAPRVPSLHEQARLQAETTAGLSQIVCYNSVGRPLVTSEAAVSTTTESLPRGLPEPEIMVAPEGMLFKLFVDRSVTDDGAHLDGESSNTVSMLRARLFTTWE